MKGKGISTIKNSGREVAREGKHAAGQGAKIYFKIAQLMPVQQSPQTKRHGGFNSQSQLQPVEPRLQSERNSNANNSEVTHA